MKPAGPPIRTPEGTIGFAFDAGMTRYAIRLRDGTILVRRMGDDQEIARFTRAGRSRDLGFRLEPRRPIPGDHESSDRCFDGLGHPAALDRSRRSAPCDWWARFSPDSQRIAVQQEEGKLLVYDLAAGEVSRAGPELRKAGGLVFRPDGPGLRSLTVTEKPPCRILDADTGRLVRSIPLPSGAGRDRLERRRYDCGNMRRFENLPLGHSHRHAEGDPRRHVSTAACKPPFTRPERCWPATAGKAD